MKHLILAILSVLSCCHALAQQSVSGKDLVARRIVRRPATSTIPADFTGDVSIKICVDSSGLVTQAEFQPELSSPTPQPVQDTLVELACKYKFVRAETVQACGVVRFRVKKE